MPAKSAVVKKTVTALLADFKGIYATDATIGTMSKRMKKVGIKPTDETRRVFREVMLSTPGLSKYISGVILNDEIIRQKVNGIPFAKFVKKNGMIPGIKVDKRAHPMANFPKERVTDGLDGLRDRFSEYVKMGAKFTKWRAVYIVGKGFPSRECMHANGHALARYAALAQEAGLVPIVEPEVLMKGKHSLAECAKATQNVLVSTFSQLKDHKVVFEGTLLKVNMVLDGLDRKQQSSVAMVAKKTLQVLQKTVPINIAGVVFLSGGQSAENASARLNEMVSLGSAPWPLGFSYERALEGPAMKTWDDKASNVPAAQRILLKRAGLNAFAREGKYNSRMEDL